MKLFDKIVRTEDDGAALALRLALGVTMFVHGSQKVFGWWGGQGLGQTIEAFTHYMGIPVVFAVLAIAAEFLGGLGLIFGLLGRVAALGIGVEMIVAAALDHVHNGFFMNWTGQQKGEGFEYHLLAVAMAVALVVRGSGTLSIDRWLAGRAKSKSAPASAAGTPGHPGAGTI